MTESTIQSIFHDWPVEVSTLFQGVLSGFDLSYAVMQPAIWDVELVVPEANDQETVMLPSVFRLAARKARLSLDTARTAARILRLRKCHAGLSNCHTTSFRYSGGKSEATRSEQRQQADFLRSRHPRADSEVTSRCDRYKIETSSPWRNSCG